MTKKTIYTFYVLIVCLVSVIVTAVMVGVVSYNLLGSAMPQYTMDNYRYDRFVTNDRFISDMKNNDSCRYKENVKCTELPASDDAITTLRMQKLQDEMLVQQHKHRTAIIESLPYLIIFLLVGLFHWRMFKAIRE